MRKRISAVAVAFLVSVATFVAPASRADAAPRWAPPSVATVHPGVQTRSPGGQCTANFVFYDAKDVYIGQAGHCASRGDNFDVNGCATSVYPLGTKITIEGASRPGTMVYDSWITMQRRRERSADLCYGNDFALVRLDRRDRGRVNPSIPFWGGPTGIGGRSDFGDAIYSYGNSSLRGGLAALSPKYGFGTGQTYGGWGHSFYSAAPGIPGDSGSAVLDANGRALGVISTVAVLPLPLENNASDLARAIRYMRAHTSLKRVQLAKGTARFQPLV
jgi:hypothetical protein